MLSWRLAYQIKFSDSQLPSKALIHFNDTNVSMVKNRIAINFWAKISGWPYAILLSFTQKHIFLHQWFFEPNQNIWKACNDIHELNLYRMHSMPVALALLKHSHKKLAVKYGVLPALFTSKRVLPWLRTISISTPLERF